MFAFGVIERSSDAPGYGSPRLAAHVQETLIY